MTDLRDDSAMEQNEEGREIFSIDEFKVAKFSTPGAKSLMGTEAEESEGKGGTEENTLTIEEVLGDKSGVRAVEVDYSTKITIVKYETDLTSPEAISETLTDAGFENRILADDESEIVDPDDPPAGSPEER
jgi:copper chaperone CopZ